MSKVLGFEIAHRIPERMDVVVDGDFPPFVLEQIRTASRGERLETALEEENGRVGRSVVLTLGECFSCIRWVILTRAPFLRAVL